MTTRAEARANREVHIAVHHWAQEYAAGAVDDCLIRESSCPHGAVACSRARHGDGGIRVRNVGYDDVNPIFLAGRADLCAMARTDTGRPPLELLRETAGTGLPTHRRWTPNRPAGDTDGRSETMMGAMPHSISTATVSRRVEWVDTDASGHQHNGLIMRLVESAEAEMMTAAGIEHDYFPTAPRVRQEIDFSGMLYFGQYATTTVTVERIGRTSITLGFEVWGEEWLGSPRGLAASGTVIAAHVPVGAKKAAPWPAAITDVLVPRH